MRDAFDSVLLELSCDMDYYVANRIELAADLGRQLSPQDDLSDAQVLKKLEQELFYVNMCKIFGALIDAARIEIDGKEVLFDRAFMLNDLRVLSYESNQIDATAAREDYYFAFKNRF